MGAGGSAILVCFDFIINVKVEPPEQLILEIVFIDFVLQSFVKFSLFDQVELWHMHVCTCHSFVGPSGAP